MTLTQDTRVTGGRTATRREYLLCRPDHFAVEYAINAWMDPSQPVDRDLALRQWDRLRATYEALGHTVHVLDGAPGLPDMVFAANCGLAVRGRVYGARFRYAERQPEAALYATTLGALRLEVVAPTQTNEGEGDFLVVGCRVLAGTGFRTSPAAHAELAAALDVEVVPLTLVDPRFYHLDTAIGVLADNQIAYWPGAFDDASRIVLRTLYPQAVLVDEEEACLLALNVVSDGRHVVLPAQATRLAAQLRERGFVAVPVDLSELLKAGGSVKCCTLEIRR